MIALFSISLLGAAYVTWRFHKLGPIQKIAHKNRLLAWLVSLLPLAVSSCFLFINTISFAVVLIHFVVIWALSDLIGLIARKIARRSFRRYWAGYVSLAVTVLWLGIGWLNAHHVFTVSYTFSSEKLSAPLRVALVADSHLGITQNGASFAREMEKLQKQNPDILVLAGDFVDDDSSREDMLAACEALGRFSCPYGVYFIYGNHDMGYFNYRNFSGEELSAALRANGVTILSDQCELIDNRFYIVGRLDRTFRNRASMESLVSGLDGDKFMLVLDHQPNAYAEEAAAGADLVLSGHTHGGHIFPAGQIGLLMGANDRRYGTETRNGTVFVVTSGISGWAIPFKTGCFSEVVLIDLQPAQSVH
ncbi:MAG: metallophosphoesterase [Clostridia bacterium]|nr:metallophosphoesterase [Clostridia bacterium]